MLTQRRPLGAQTAHGSPTATVRAAVRRAAEPLALAGGVGATAVLLTWLGPGTVVPLRCPFRSLTGLDCPFCGGTHAAAALVRGDLVTALGYNALTTVGLLALAGVWVLWLVARWRGRPFELAPGRRFWLAFLVVTAVFWVARNLSGPFAALAA